MIYAILGDDGSAHQIVQSDPPGPFATTQLKVAADEAEHYEAKAGDVISHPLIHAANAMECWGQDDFARYQVFQADEPQIPEDQVLTRLDLTIADGKLSVRAIHSLPAPPETVSAAAFKIILDGKESARTGKTRLDDFEDVLAADGSVSQRLYWTGMQTFNRDSEKLREILSLAACDEAEFQAHLRSAGKLI